MSKAALATAVAVGIMMAVLSAVPVMSTAHALFTAAAPTPEEEAPATSGGLFNQTRAVDMPPLLAPAEQDGRLRFYYFVNLSLQVRGGEVWRVRERLPFVQDAFVGSVYDSPLILAVAADAPDGTVDEAALKQLLLATARRELGADTVVDIEIKSFVRGMP